MDGLTKLTTINQSYMPLDVFEKLKTKNTFLSVTKTITQERNEFTTFIVLDYHARDHYG